MAMIKTFVLGVVLGMGLLVLAGYLFILLGGMPVATTTAPLPFERYLAKKALQAAVHKEIGGRAPIPSDDTNLLAGAKVGSVASFRLRRFVVWSLPPTHVAN